MVACIISWRSLLISRPQMVAGMAVGGGHNGAVGSLGIMTLLGATIAGDELARGAAMASGAGAVSEGATASYKLLMDRIQAAEAAIAAGSGNGGALRRADNYDQPYRL